MGQVASALSIIDQARPSVIQPGGSLPEIRSVGSVETRYGLVAILVDDELLGSSTSGGGFFSFLGTAGLKEKIQTYAQDVQATLPWTKTVIVEVADTDTPVEIQRMLERFYFEGNPEDSDPTKLSGVVIVGDVPLPVVNKLGNRFISLLPYTDFEEPAYLLDSETQDFLPNAAAQNLQNEIWHGVIVPPLDGQEGIDLLATYFDKNHAFHTGDEDATSFNQKVFIGDLITEASALNPTAFASYERFTNLWEEIAYYRYTNDLVEDLYTQMQTSVEEGDFLDNDSDGFYDEEASNGIDDDNDGLVDEDLGDGFFGIDNDGDGVVDEDSFEDNNNDEGWIYSGYEGSEAESIFSDHMLDEDPPGDTTGGEDQDGDGYLDGDGCPGLCGQDDNGDGVDSDLDGYPTGIEVLYHWDWADERIPWGNVKDWTNAEFAQSFSSDEAATAYLSEMFVDQFFGDAYKSPTCYFDGVYHPEYDDDEDGFCDEDGKEEMQIWANENGTRASGTCAYNDGDCDGVIDEDPIGLKSEGMFDNLPDIQAKRVVESLTSRYASMFDEPQGVWNRIVGQTGRYETRSSDGETVSNDYDSTVSLIAKKDELVLQYLTELNASMEAKVDAIVEDHLAQDIPLIAGVQITGKITTENEDGDEEGTDEICDDEGEVDLGSDKCLQFVNQSGFDPLAFGILDEESSFLDIFKLGAEHFYIAGEHLWDVTSPAQCTTFAGTDEVGGQLAQFNSLYSREFSVAHNNMSIEELQDYRNCVPEFASYLKDIPQVCNVATTVKSVRTLDGAKAPDEDTDTSKWDVGAEACFEFRELETFNDYTQSQAEFNNWLSLRIRVFRESGATDTGETYQEFLGLVEEQMDTYTPRPDEATLRKQFRELDLLRADDERSYTMIDLLEELGYKNVSDDDVDTFIAMLDDESDFVTVDLDVDDLRDLVDELDEIVQLQDNDRLIINHPKQGSGMDDVQSLELIFNRLYLIGGDVVGEAGVYGLSDTRLAMNTITSVHKHVEPTSETLNAQVTNAGSPNMPIDATRRISFIDNGDDARELVYVNVFEAETVEDVQDQITALADEMAIVAGGGSFVNDVKNFYDNKKDGINEYQLKDALAWRYMSIDEKHRYVLSHYLGEQEAIVSKARKGYEMVSIIADGSATEISYSMNGGKPGTEEDPEYNYRDDAGIAAALAASQDTAEELEPISPVSNTTPVLLSEWIEAMDDWMAEVEDSLSSGGTANYCGEDYIYPSDINTDSDASGIPDGADATTSLLLSSDDINVLLAEGEGNDSYVVSVGAKQADGTINTLDNYTQVKLQILSGDTVVEVQGTDTLTLTGGVAVFELKGELPGSFALRAEAANRDDVSSSNSLNGTVVSKYVNIMTLIKEMTGTDGESTVVQGNRIEVTDAEGEVRAVLDPETGGIELRGAEAELREAESSAPTRIAILGEDGTVYGSFFLIPSTERVAIGNGPSGVFVQVVGGAASAAMDENGVALEVTLEDTAVQMGLVTGLGQIAVADGYSLEFDNPSEINLYDPVHVLSGDGETLFTVTINHSFTEGNIEEAIVEGVPEDFSSLGSFDHEPGVYAASKTAAYERIAVSSGDSVASTNIFTNDIPADGKSEIYVRAEIRDQADKVYGDDNTSVIEFVLSTEDHGEIETKRVQVSGGVAEAKFVTTKVAGDVTVEGRITDGSLPSLDAQIHVYPGEPVRLELQGESRVLPAGAEAATDMTVYLYDQFGNLASNGFYPVTFTTEGGVTLLDLNDEDSTADGVQVTTADGSIAFRVLASPEVESASVQVSLPQIPDGGDSFNIEHKESLALKVSTTKPYLFAGGSNGQTLTVSVVDELGIPVSGFNGDVLMSVSDPGYGSFESDTLTLDNGKASTTLLPGTLAGSGSIIAESAGIQGGSSTVVLKPADIYELRIRKEDGTFNMAAGEKEKFYIEGFDVYGNLVDTDSSTSGTLRLTDATAEYGTLSSETFALNQGVATVRVTTGEVSGKISLVASATGLLAGVWGGDVSYRISGEEFADMDLQMLYGSVLGAPFGDVTQENYVAGWMTFNGKTQAVTSLISEPIPKKRIASVDANGAVSLPEDGMVSQVVNGAGSELPTHIQWRSFPDDILIGELFYVLSEDMEISAELITSKDTFTLEASDGTWVLREDNAAVVKVRTDGQVVLVDPTYSLVVNGAAQGLGFGVLKNTEQIMSIDFSGEFGTDVSAVDTNFDLEDWASQTAGVYLKPTGASVNRIVRIPTGNSSQNPMGLAIIDPETDLAKEMQPSLGYQSLEAAEDNGNIGWEDENKHLLLFAAGNTVGQSNLYYPSEVGVVLGDPTIKLPTLGELGTLGYTSDVGTLVSTSNEEVLTLMDLDYNGDDLPDVLTAYKDGRIEVLQNAKAATRLHNRGELLYIENGISSIDKGDFNNDGLEDLLIVTEEACYEGEMCLYLYENIGGGFVAKNLALTGISGTPTQVEVGDLNDDDYDDLVIVDENMVMYTVWNSEGVLETVDEVKDFGLNADPEEELGADVAVRTDDLAKGSVSLGILTDDFSEENGAEDFLAALGVDDDYTAASTEGLQRKENQAFEYADSRAMEDLVAVSKTVADPSSGSVEVGDVLTYTVTVENISGAAYSALYLSDSVGNYFQFDEDSFACSDCSPANTGVTIQEGDNNRPFIYGPLSLSNGESLTFTYDVSVESLPKLSVMLSQDLYTDYKDDNYMDIGVSPEGNTSGELIVFYSDGYVTHVLEEGFLGLGGNSFKQVNYQEKAYSPATYAEEDNTIPNPFGDEDGDGVPDFLAKMDQEKGIPVAKNGDFDAVGEVLGAVDEDEDGYYSTDEMFDNTEDADGDGINDIIDIWVSGNDLLLDPTLNLEAADDDVELSDEELEIDLEADIALLDKEVEGLTDKIEEIVSMFTCNGGCIAFPGSVAFLAPGNYHEPLTGTTLFLDPGTPIFGIINVLPVACTAQMCYAPGALRLYLAPTTTLGLGLGICLGPYPVGQCFAFSIPLLQLLSLCDVINGYISDGLSSASAFVTGEADTAYNVVENLSSDNGSTGLESTVFASYEPPVSANLNVQVPGFPSIFTEWWKAQKEEFFKVLDLPDITFIYPDPKSLTTEFTGISERIDKSREEDAVDADGTRKIDELTSGILGLEKWLNTAHALPLIDIEPEPVTIRYPMLTPEEIEIFKRDMQAWVDDAKLELEALREQIEIMEDLTEIQKAAIEELETTVTEAITAIETNLAILESYTEIPEKILLIRDIEAYYAKTIICYVDAILSNTAGYLTENVERIEAWGQWVVALQEIVDGWQVLIDLSADLMDSCDKCTNQRYSGLQLLFSLFVFIPDFPVVELPKLPDIVIDVSNIQAGMDIVWPDIKFVPERINIPELPRLVIPDLDIKLDADFDLELEIPLLPTFDFNFEPPALPPLTLPNLPSLPPPPALPELDPSLQAALNIASNILKIVCIIRQGFIPTPELTLKSKIEEITERPGGIVLPSDLSQTVEWPEFNFDYWKEIRVNTTLNLNLDFSALYNEISDLGEKSNAEITKFVQEAINDNLNDLQDEIKSIFDLIGDQELEVGVDVDIEGSADFSGDDAGLDGDADAEGEAEGDFNTELESYEEAMNTALSYSDNPLVLQNLGALKQVMGGLQTKVDAWSAELPDEVLLKGEEEMLALDDPRLHRYNEIVQNPSFDKDFLASIEGTPLASLVTLRDSMIAYTEELDQGTIALRGMDGESFQRYLASENMSSPFMLASEEGGFMDAAANWNPEKWATPAEDDEAVELASESTDGLELGTQARTYDEGLFLYNAELGVNERLSDYTQEAKEASSILMIDLDGDGDEDVVYSMGGDIYLKENHTEAPTLSYVSSDPEESTVPDMDPGYGSVQNLKRGKNDYEEASFSFSPSDSIGYDVRFYDSLDAQESEPDENIKRLLLLVDSENESSTFADSTGKSAGQLRSSRLWADNVSGSVTVKNGYKRTIINANGEITVSEAVVFQTIEDSVIEFEADEGATSIDVPAHTVVSFAQGTEKNIRVENGSVYWVDMGETVEEQDLAEGMELFAEELVALESKGADAVLVTTEGTELRLDKQEAFVMDKLISQSSPSANIELENGAYYTVSRSVQADGSFGTLSDTILLNPQVCADDSEPYTLIDDGGADTDGDGAIEVAIFSTKELSAEGSFDSDSEIVDAYWDLDSGVDSDGDGVSNNDEQVIGLTAEVGPYEDLNTRTVTLYVTDAAGNVGETEVAVEIYVPDITLADASIDAVSGFTTPSSPLFPFDLVRDRSGAINEIGTGYSTDEAGDFNEDMIPSDLLSVYDGAGETIAQFNPTTKQVVVYDPAYDAMVLSSDADWPSRLAVYEKSLGMVMGSFLFVADGEHPIQKMTQPLADLDLSIYQGLTVYPVAGEDGYEFTDNSLVARDDLGSLDFIVSETGNITIFDERYTLVKREAASLDEYLVIEVYDNGTLELEIWPGTPKARYLVSAVDLDLPPSTLIGAGDSLSADYRLNFEDIENDDELYQDIAELVERDVLEGYTIEGQAYFKPDQSITRAEFTKIILGILCITPSDEAYLLPSVFNDILDSGAWYYSFTKESFLRDLITGYLGEVNSSGVAPFKPNATITRAEATKIVLEALNQEGIIELPADLTGEPWYEPYMEIAQDLTPYLTGDATAGESNFIVTEAEAADPSHKMTRYEFVEMSVRVLKAYNCFDLDSDGDGLINYDEESKYGTDPYNPDTDSGGVDDGSEVGRSSDPLDESDDFGDGSLEGVEPGIYAVREACMACPCNSTIDYDADLRPGDEVFAIIRNDAGEIFGVSNTLTIQE